MEYNKNYFKKGNKCLLVVMNAYNQPRLKLEGEIRKVGKNHIVAVSGKASYEFNYSLFNYNCLRCVDEYMRTTFLFKDTEELQKYMLRERYLIELKKLFESPSSVELSLEELKQIYDLLKKEKNNGTK